MITDHDWTPCPERLFVCADLCHFQAVPDGHWCWHWKHEHARTASQPSVGLTEQGFKEIVDESGLV